MTKSKKFILWDNDGVLVETEPLYFESGKIILAELGLHLSWQDYMPIMISGNSIFDLVPNLTPTKRESLRNKRNQIYQDLILSRNIEIPGVWGTLEILAKEYRMGIVTSSKREDFDLIHRNRPTLQYMEFVIAAEDVSNHKPHPEPYLLGLQKLGAHAEETVVIEDSQRGLASARAAGIGCIVLKNQFTATQDFSGCLTVLPSITELPRYLKSSW